MKKKLIKTTFILLILSCLSKLLSFLVRIFLARNMPKEAMNYYSLAMPTMLLVIPLAQMGMPNALAKSTASLPRAAVPLKTAIIFSFFNNLLLSIVFVLAIPLICFFIFHENVLIPVLYSCIWMIPLVSISGLCKGYLLGKQRMLAYSSSQVTEEVFRFLFLIITLPLYNNPIIMAKLAILSMAIGELGSAMHMLVAMLFKRKTKAFLQVKSDKQSLQNLLKTALPMTFSRLIGSFCYFLEPIVMLLQVSFSKQAEMIEAFTLLNSYVQPIITLPSFITIMISNWVLPIFSAAKVKKDHTKMVTVFLISCGFSVLVSLSWSGILYFFPEEICFLLYKQSNMASMLKKLALPFGIYGLQPILSILLHSLDLSKQAMLDTLFGCIFHLILLYLAPLWIGSEAIGLSLVCSMLITTLLHLYHALKTLFFNHI